MRWKSAVCLVLCMQIFMSSPATALVKFGSKNVGEHPVTAYCMDIQSSIRQEWRTMDGFDRPVLIDVDLDANGKVTTLGVSKNDESSADARTTAILLASLVDQLPAPPHGSLKLQICLCNDRKKITVAARDIDWEGYFEKVYRRVRKAWSSLKLDQNTFCVFILRVLSSGQIDDMRLLQTSGLVEFDRAAFTAVSRSVPFQPLPDGTPGFIDIAIRFDIDVNGKPNCSFKSNSQAVCINWHRPNK